VTVLLASPAVGQRRPADKPENPPQDGDVFADALPAFRDGVTLVRPIPRTGTMVEPAISRKISSKSIGS
jgi:hypothetical protein